MFKKVSPSIPVNPEPPSKDQMMEDIENDSGTLNDEVYSSDCIEGSSDDEDRLPDGAEMDDVGPEDVLDSALGAPTRRQAFKAVVNLIEAWEELQRTVPLAQRDTPAFKAYQNRIFEVMQECLRQLMRTRCLMEDFSWYERLVPEIKQWNQLSVTDEEGTCS